VSTSNQVLSQGIIQSGILRGLNKDTQKIPGNNFDTCSTPIFTCKVKHKNVLQIFNFFAHDTYWESKKGEEKKRSAFQRMECLLMGAFCFLKCPPQNSGGNIHKVTRPPITLKNWSKSLQIKVRIVKM
jgi:hypothetical protein